MSGYQNNNQIPILNMKGVLYMANNQQQLDEIFANLITLVNQQSTQLKLLADKIEQLDVGGGGSGNATIEDYTLGKTYQRNTLVVYEPTETVYRALSEFTATDFNTEVSGDGTPGSIKLKLVGFESSIVTYGAPPTQEEVNALPEDTIVAIYNSAADPYDLT